MSRDQRRWENNTEMNLMEMESIIFRDITPCSPLRINRHFGGDMFLRNVGLNGLHGVISQKMVLFITTAVRTPNPTYGNGLSE
jgi:hypothetical protein